ncbi:MAG: hypothetical protein EOM80_03295 [Erysipelotrichia bacterium]|nr:hypothetical protein [Erysipelotrichia bacterium]
MNARDVTILLALIMLFLHASQLFAIDKRQQALEVLRAARLAHQNNQTVETQRLLVKARLLWKAMPSPAWLNEIPRHMVAPTIPTTRADMLRIFREKPDRELMKVLEQYLEKNPDDIEIRRLLFYYALEIGDAEAVRRHKSYFLKNRTSEWLVKLKTWAALIILILAMWQVTLLVLETRYQRQRSV